VLYTTVFEDNCLYSLFLKEKNTSFYIYVTLIAKCYMKCILENSCNKNES